MFGSTKLVMRLGAPLGKLEKCYKLNYESGNRISSVDLPYIPLSEVGVHMFDDNTTRYAWYRVNYVLRERVAISSSDKMSNWSGLELTVLKLCYRKHNLH